MSANLLSPEQESQAQQLAQQIQRASQEDILALARLLVSKPEADIFGDTEFQARDIIHGVAAKAFAVHLAQKKTAIAAAASSVATASKPPSSKTTGPKRR